MAAIRGFSRYFYNTLNINKYFNYANARCMGYYIPAEHPHNDKYEYEVSRDPEDWKFVTRLLPRSTVPEPKVLETYPSGWRPVSDKALQHPYFVQRSKNHMLSAYLKIYNRGQLKVTIVKKIHGDIWRLHDELKEHIEKEIGKRIPSYVIESNAMVKFKGDYVYYVEQWMLEKGF